MFLLTTILPQYLSGGSPEKTRTLFGHISNEQSEYSMMEENLFEEKKEEHHGISE